MKTEQLIRTAMGFNSATTVMSWNGHLIHDVAKIQMKLQFGHDGDVMEWDYGYVVVPSHSPASIRPRR